MSSSSVIHGDAECGDKGITLGEGTGLFTMCKLSDGLCGKPNGDTPLDDRAIGGGKGGGGGGSGGGVVFFLKGEDEGT